MYEAFKSACHDSTSKDEVEIYKEDIIVKMEALIMMKEMENKKILRTNTKIFSTQ